MSFAILNNSGATRAGLTFTDAFPAGLTAVGGAVTLVGACTGLAPAVIGAGAAAYNLTALNNLLNGATCTLSFLVQGTTAGVKSNTVNGTAPAQFLARPTRVDHGLDAPTIAKAFAPSTVAAPVAHIHAHQPEPFAALTARPSTHVTNMSVSGAQAVGGTCVGTTPAALVNGATALSFTAITIPAGGSCTITIVVSSLTPGVQPNATSGVTTTQTPAAGAVSPTVNLTVGGINVTKAFNPVSRALGVPSNLTITLTSPQLVNWSGIAFTDTLPANLLVANPSNAVTTCGAATLTATPAPTSSR
jgi:hypothetical protein